MSIYEILFGLIFKEGFGRERKKGSEKDRLKLLYCSFGREKTWGQVKCASVSSCFVVRGDDEASQRVLFRFGMQLGLFVGKVGDIFLFHRRI